MVRICKAGDQLSSNESAHVQCSPFHLALTLQNIEANPSKLVNVGVVDFGKKANLRGGHRVVIGQEKLEFEDAACALA